MNESSHRRLNILTNEWLLVSPHRMQRPWQGKVETLPYISKPHYDPACYLCPGNERANGNYNPAYTSTFVFDNDFSAIKKEGEPFSLNHSKLIQAKSEKGICRVVCFSPRHDLTLAELELPEIVKVIEAWQNEYKSLGNYDYINHIQIFENKGEIMGCSNPHPHGQIWAEESIPVEPMKEQINQMNYYNEHRSSLLLDYLNLELDKKAGTHLDLAGERIVYENKSFVLLVPFWAVWPYETMIVPKRNIQRISQFTQEEVELFADALKIITVKYDNIFNNSFPYSSGIHQAPTDGDEHKEWQFHMHFYPPLLRSATVKKFMVGYEMFANPQRDITPERSAEVLINASTKHYSMK